MVVLLFLISNSVIIFLKFKNLKKIYLLYFILKNIKFKCIQINHILSYEQNYMLFIFKCIYHLYNSISSLLRKENFQN